MDESTIVTIAIKDNTLLITPTKKKSKGTTKKAKNGNALTDGLIEEYKETFKKLAKT